MAENNQKEYRFKKLIELARESTKYIYIVNPTHSSGIIYNVSCGDTINISIKADSGFIDKISIEGECCTISKAAAVQISKDIQGLELNKVSHNNLLDSVKKLGFQEDNLRIDCAYLPVEAFSKALGII